MAFFSFPKSARIGKKRFFEYIFENGKKNSHKNLAMWHIVLSAEASALLKEQPDSKKMAVMASRKLGNAVRRNRVKRIIREAYRLQKHRITGGVCMIIYPLKNCKLESTTEAAEELEFLWRKAKILKDEK